MSKYELENGWTLDDVLDAHEVLDLHHDIEVMAANDRYLEQRVQKVGRRG